MIISEVDEIRKEHPVPRDELTADELENLIALYPQEYIKFFNSEALVAFP